MIEIRPPTEAERPLVARFLAGEVFALAGASRNRAKVGNRILRRLLELGKKVHVVHPQESSIEGIPCLRRLADVPAPVDGVSIVTPPRVTEALLDAVVGLGDPVVWIQPGAADEAVLEKARRLSLHFVAGGPCLLRETEAQR